MVQRPSTKNRVIIWTQRDNEGLNKSGYRRDLGAVIIDRKVK
jgi:hypothetical protein